MPDKRNRKVVVVGDMLHPVGHATLRQEADLVVISRDDPEGFRREVVDARAAVPGGGAPADGALMDTAPRLEVLASLGSGIDTIDEPAATERGILVTNNAGVAPGPVVEHIIALMICLNKHIVRGDRHLRSGGDWPRRWEFKGRELAGCTLGIVGLGAIGARLAAVCRAAFEMRIIAYDPYAAPGRAEELGVDLLGTLPELLKEADFVSLNCPVTQETRHMIDAGALSLMKPEAYLVQVARGALIVEEDLVAALRAGTIAGAAIDSFDPEPPPPDHPLFRLENVIVTPHHGGQTEEALARLARGTAESILQVLRGERPERLANPRAWPAYLERMGRRS